MILREKSVFGCPKMIKSLPPTFHGLLWRNLATWSSVSIVTWGVIKSEGYYHLRSPNHRWDPASPGRFLSWLCGNGKTPWKKWLPTWTVYCSLPFQPFPPSAFWDNSCWWSTTCECSTLIVGFKHRPSRRNLQPSHFPLASAWHPCTRPV